MDASFACAWNRDGYCMMHKASCSCFGNCMTCSDRVAKAQHVATEAFGFRHVFNLNSVKGRMQRRTYGVDGGVVYSQCKSKRRYAGQNRANEVLRARVRNGAGPLRVYHCPFCNGYHLTSKCYHDGDGVIKVA